MNKIFCFLSLCIALFVFLPGCENNINIERETSSGTVTEQATSYALTDESSGGSTADTYTAESKFIIVDEPIYNRVTNQIKKSMIGKYAIPEDPDSYFEFKEDGTFKISINAFDGYAKYDSDDADVFAFYTADCVYISFNLNKGEYTFPGSRLTIEFSSKDEKTFSSDSDYLKYVKQ